MTEDIEDNAPYSLKGNAVDANTLIGKTHSALKMDIAISVYFVVMVMIMGVVSYLGFDRLWISLLIVALLFSLIFIYILRLRNTVLLKDMVDRWMANNAKISRALRYEMMPVQGETDQEKAENIIFSLYEGSEKYFALHPDSLKPGETTKSGFKFDLVCRAKKSIMFVKFIDRQGPATASDLEEIRKAALEHAGGAKSIEITAVSRLPFDADALSLAEKADAAKSGATFDLVRLLEGGYFAAHVGERQDG